MRVRASVVQDRYQDAYQRLKRPVMRRARCWFPSLPEVELEDIYQSAWLSVVRTEADVRDVEDYVYAAVRSQGLMELRRRRRRPVVALADVGGVDGPSDPEGHSTGAAIVDDAAAATDERADTRLMSDWVRDLLAELSPRQRSVVKLRWGWGLSRAEIAGFLGVSEKTVKRELEVSGRRLSEDAEEFRSGRWCTRRRSLVTAYALELLSPAQTARAEAHLHACSGCRGLVHELRRRAEVVAAVVPAPAFLEGPMRGPVGAVGDVLDSARAQLADVASSAKHQAVSLSLRATDPTPLAGARPGAVGAVVAGCLAVGGGAYCAVEGAVPEPLRVGPLSQERASAQQPKAGPSKPVSTEPDPSPPPAPAPQADAPVPVAEPAPPVPSAPPPEPAPEPEPSKDFFGSEPTAPPRARAAGVEPAPSAPAPAAPRGEFDGP